MMRTAILLPTAMLAGAVGIAGVLEAVGVVDLPLALDPLAEDLKVVFPLHMGFSGCGLIAIIMTLALRRFPGPHRFLGRVALICVLVGGVAALPTAAASRADLLARVGFGVQAVAWLSSAAIGFLAVRAGRLALHRAAMTLMAATASGAVVLRLMLAALTSLGKETSLWYGAIAWASWLLPVGVVLASLTVGKSARLTHKGSAILAAPGR